MNKEKLRYKLYSSLEDIGLFDDVKDLVIERIMKAIPEDSIYQVEEFHRTFLPEHLGANPAMIKYNRIALRLELLLEEIGELAEAMGKLTLYRNILKSKIIEITDVSDREDHNMENILDALSDIQYILDGTYVELGLQDVKQDASSEVHRSNMSKAADSQMEAEEAARVYRSQGFIVTINRVGDKFVLYRVDGKVLKSKNFSLPQLGGLLWSGKT